MKRSHILFLALVLTGFSCSKKRYADALTPEEALKSFQLNEDFNIEVFAAEPFIADPVDLAFDEDGNTFVVEMPDYPYKPEPGKGRGRIKLLLDTNGDGRVDKATVFADSISEATSILPWKGGLLVAAAPNIWFMKDTTGDFQADIKKVLFKGFFETNSEAQITCLRYGIDNWIYASNNGQAGSVTSETDPGKPALEMRSADFRFKPETGEFEQESGPGQFGQSFNEWGHRFVTQNTIRIQHMVMPWRYAHRNESLPSKKGVQDISNGDLTMFQETPPPYWRAERTARRVKEYAEQGLDRKEYAEDHFTGASGGTVYAGQTFPEKYVGNIFIGEVAGNLVHRDLLTPRSDSPTYFAGKDSISESNREFLSSTDPWFRPDNFTVGHDGALYVVDFYRQHIETPVSIPENLKTDMDFMKGSDMGRVYRITPKNPVSTDKTAPKLSKMSSAELVKLLAHKGQWWRLQAQRLLLDRQDKTVIPAVTALFTEEKDPKARLHAFFVLDGLKALNANLIKQAMKDPAAGVREYGAMLSEKYPQLLSELIKATADSSVRVAFQATLSLGQFSTKEVAPAMAKVLEKYPNDPWFKMAVLSSKAGSSPEIIKSLSTGGSFFREATPGKISFLEDYAYIAGSGNRKEETRKLLQLFSGNDTGEEWKLATLRGLMKGMKTSKDGVKPDDNQKRLLLAMLPSSGTKVHDAVEQIIDL
jgi:putative membrane-bound dehydrogenase-like protein